MKRLILAAISICICATASEARHRQYIHFMPNGAHYVDNQRYLNGSGKHHRVRHSRKQHHNSMTAPQLKKLLVNVNRAGLTTVMTVYNISITVDKSVSQRFTSFFADLKLKFPDYQPNKIHCYSTAHSHVKTSNHFWGGACDIEQRGWGLTSKPMYHIKDIAKKNNLRDGCDFGDCGHIDVPLNLARHIRYKRYAQKKVIWR